MMKLFRNTKRLPGITLVETIVYLGLFGLIFTSIIQFVFTINENNQRADRRAELSKAIIFSAEHITTNFNTANAIDEANSVFDSDNGKIRLTTATGFVEYSLSAGRINFNDNGTSNFITNPEFSVSKFNCVRVLKNNNSLVGFRLTMTIASSKDANVAQTIETAYIIK